MRVTLLSPKGASGLKPVATENSSANRCKTIASTIVEVISSSQFEPGITMSPLFGVPPFPIQKIRGLIARIFTVASDIELSGKCEGATIVANMEATVIRASGGVKG